LSYRGTIDQIIPVYFPDFVVFVKSFLLSLFSYLYGGQVRQLQSSS